MALVPGLEETNSEFYRSIVKLLEDAGKKVGTEHLYHSIWKTISLNPSIRIGAINFLMETMEKGNKSGNARSQLENAGGQIPNQNDSKNRIQNSSTLVLNAMIRAIDDPVVLVQRAVLDLILAHFRLSDQTFEEAEVSKLIHRALLLLLRREASLNRRVYNWLLGEDAKNSAAYFERFAKRPLVMALDEMFTEATATSASNASLEKAVMPFKILLALFDKPEVSAPIINEMLETIFEALHKFCADGYVYAPEIVAQVNTVLDGLRPNIIWQFINQFVRQDIQKIVNTEIFQTLSSTEESQSHNVDYANFIDSGSMPQYYHAHGKASSSKKSISKDKFGISSSSTPISNARSLILAGTLLDKMIGLNSFDAITHFLPEFIASLTWAANLASQKPQHHTIALHCLTLILKVIGKMQQPIARSSSAANATSNIRSTSPTPTASVTGPNSGTSSSSTTNDTTLPMTSLSNASSSGHGAQNSYLTSSSGQVSPTLPSEVLRSSVKLFENFYRDLCLTYLPPVWKQEVEEAKTIVPNSSVVSGRQNLRFGPGGQDIASPSQSRIAVNWRKSLATTIHDAAGQILSAFFSTFWSTFGLEAPDPTKTALHEWFLCEHEHPVVAGNAIKTLVSFLTLPTASNPSAANLRAYFLYSTRVCHTLAYRMWNLLAPQTSIVHYRIAAIFLELKDVCSEICEDVICEALLASDIEKKLEALQRFALLWRLSSELGTSCTFDRALFLMLDSLNDEQPIIKLACRTWLADSIAKVERILDPLLLVLLDKTTSRTTNGVYQGEYDCRRVLYALKVLQSIIECDFKLWMQNAMNRPASREIIARYRQQVIPDPTPSNLMQPQLAPTMPSTAQNANSSNAQLRSQIPQSTSPGLPEQTKNNTYANDAFSFIPVETYLDLLVVQSLRFITGVPPRNATSDFITKNSVVQTTAVGFLQFLLSKITAGHKASELALVLHEPILQALAQSVSDTHLILQVNLLGLIRTIVLIDNAIDSRAKKPNNEKTSNASGAPSSAQTRPSLRVIDAIGHSQLFLQTINIGLLQANTDFNIRFYWLDFVTSCLPYLSYYAHILLPPIIQCLCDIISTHRNAYDSIESKDTLMILRAMKIILHHATTISPNEASVLVHPSTGTSYGGNSSTSSSASNAPNSSSNAQGAQGGANASAQSGSGFSSFFKTLFVSEGVGSGSGSNSRDSSPAPMSAIESILERLQVIVKGLIKVWGNTTPHFKCTFGEFGANLTGESLFVPPLDSPSLGPSSNNASRPTNNNFKVDADSQFTSDEIHNRYLVQDQLLALMEMLYNASPSKFLDCMLRDWVYISRHPEQLLGANAPRLNALDQNFGPEHIRRAQRHKALCIDILNHMSNVNGESIYKSLGEVLKACHASDQQRNLRLAQAKRRGVNYTHLQDSSIAEFGVLVADWGNHKISEQSLGSVLLFVRTLLTSHNPQAIFQAWKLLDCVFIKLFGASPYGSPFRSGWYIGQRTSSSSSISSKQNNSSSSSNNAPPMSGSTTTPALMNSAKVKKEVLSVMQALCDATLTTLNKTFVDLSCSWRAAWRYADVFDERSDPVVMDESTVASIRTLVSLQATICLRDHLISVAERLSDDSRVALATSNFPAIILQLSSSLQNESMKSPSLAQESAALLERIAAAPHVLDARVWRKAAMDVFLWWPDFLRVSSGVTLRCFQRIVANLFTTKQDSDGNAWADFTKYVGKAVAAQTMFTSQIEASAQRALAVRRLAFLILSGTNDQFLDQLPWIQEKLVEALRQREGHSDTFSAVFLCLRVLLIKLKPDSLRSFWPAIISEMLAVFTPVISTGSGSTSSSSLGYASLVPSKDGHPINSKESSSSGSKDAVKVGKDHYTLVADPELVFAVTKFLDLLFMLPSEQFNIHEWAFIAEPASADSTEFPQQKWPFVPYIDRVSHRSSRTSSSLPSTTSLIQFGTQLSWSQAPGTTSSLKKSSLIPSSSAPSCTAAVVPIHKLDANPTPGGMTWEAFQAFLAKYSDLQYLNRVGTQNFANPEDVANLILSDFAVLQSRGLEPSDWTLLKVSSSQGPSPTAVGSSPPPMLPDTNVNQNQSQINANQTQHRPRMPSSSSSSSNSNPASASASSALPSFSAVKHSDLLSISSTLVPSSSPANASSNLQSISSPPTLNLDPEDNANATLFGDVLD